MGGYRRAAKVYRLKFTDAEFAGLEVRAKSVSLETFLELTALVELQSAAFGPEQVEQVARLFDVFGEVLVSWNLEDEDGVPVPATLAGLKSQEFDFVLQIIMVWMDAIAGVTAPLANRSSDGEVIPEASLPMAPISPSPQLSTVLN